MLRPMLALLLASSLALATDRPVTLAGGLGGTAAPGSLGGFVHGTAVFWPKTMPVGLDLSGREGVATNDTRTVGTVEVMARWMPRGPLYLKGGFAHHHETPIALAQENPVMVTLGSAPGIRHRTGLGASVGVDLNIPERTLDDRLGIAFELSVSVLPDANGPPVYVFLEQAWTLDVGKLRE
jgi:hypothetical protein